MRRVRRIVGGFRGVARLPIDPGVGQPAMFDIQGIEKPRQLLAAGEDHRPVVGARQRRRDEAQEDRQSQTERAGWHGIFLRGAGGRRQAGRDVHAAFKPDNANSFCAAS